MNWDYAGHNHYWNYSRYNFCVKCRLRYDKSVLRCTECKNKIRSRPQTKTGQRDHKRL